MPPKDRAQEDDFFYIAMNMHWEPQRLALPDLPAGMRWEKGVGYAGRCGGNTGRSADKIHHRSGTLHPGSGKHRKSGQERKERKEK